VSPFMPSCLHSSRPPRPCETRRPCVPCIVSCHHTPHHHCTSTSTHHASCSHLVANANAISHPNFFGAIEGSYRLPSSSSAPFYLALAVWLMRGLLVTARPTSSQALPPSFAVIITSISSQAICILSLYLRYAAAWGLRIHWTPEPMGLADMGILIRSIKKAPFIGKCSSTSGKL